VLRARSARLVVAWPLQVALPSSSLARLLSRDKMISDWGVDMTEEAGGDRERLWWRPKVVWMARSGGDAASLGSDLLWVVARCRVRFYGLS
jgi:hypothetical protein